MSERTENPNWPTPEQVQSALTWARMFGHTETGWAAKILAKEQARLRAEQSLPALRNAAPALLADLDEALELLDQFRQLGGVGSRERVEKLLAKYKERKRE